MKWIKTLKETFKVAPSKVKVLVAGTLVTFFATSAIAFAGWTPDRPTFDWNTEADRVGSLNGPRMNSFINTPYYGDERAFFDACSGNLSACASDNGGVFKDVLANPTTSTTKTVTLRTYVHNGANQSTNDSGVGVAKDAKVRIDLPTGTETALRMRSYISISNPAEGYPAEVTDTTELVDGKPFAIKYKAGSAKVFTAAHQNGLALSDNIVTSGATLGYDQLNGNMPGCFEFQAMVTIEVEVEVADQNLVKVVRKAGDSTYGDLATVKPGEKVEWRIFWQNTGDRSLDDVVVTDQLPPHTTLVPGSVRWIYRGTDSIDHDEVQPDNDLFTKYVNFGDWGSNGGFYLRFDTTALGDFEGCETTIRNLAHAHNNQNPNDKTDWADVKIVKENCKDVTPSYVCNSLSATLVRDRTYRFTANATAAGGATIKHYIYNFGDGTPELTTDKTTVEHTYAKDGSYASSVRVVVTVNGQDQIINGDACKKVITISPVVTTKKLPDTGPESVAGLVSAGTAIGYITHRIRTLRKLS